jgi:hypothetical protein
MLGLFGRLCIPALRLIGSRHVHRARLVAAELSAAVLWIGQRFGVCTASARIAASTG